MLNGFNSLDAQAAAKIVTAKLRLELGNTSSVKWFSGIGEYVIDWGPGYRIYRKGWRLADRVVRRRNQTPTANRYCKGEGPSRGIQSEEG